jgi:hypothetical protein
LLSSRGQFFLFRVGLAQLQCLLLGSRNFLFERREGKCFVELVRLVVLFDVGLTQFFVGVALSEAGS